MMYFMMTYEWLFAVDDIGNNKDAATIIEFAVTCLTKKQVDFLEDLLREGDDVL